MQLQAIGFISPSTVKNSTIGFETTGPTTLEYYNICRGRKNMTVTNILPFESKTVNLGTAANESIESEGCIEKSEIVETY
jgi:hypothetical protein